VTDVVVRGVRHHVQRLGAVVSGQRAVVFVHGLVMDNLSSFYFTLANPLAAHHAVMLYDLRGHGMSERPAIGYDVASLVDDLGALLDAQQLGLVTLVGNSFGGLVALATALARPRQVERLVLIDAHDGTAGWADKMAATLSLTGADRDATIATSFAAWLGRHSERKRTKLQRTAEALIEGTSLIADLRASPPLRDAELATITCPVLALYGERSDVRDRGEALARLLPRCTLELLPGCSHSVLWEATNAVRDRIVAELAREAP